MALLMSRRVFARSTLRWRLVSRCSTPATSMAWATMRCCCGRRCVDVNAKTPLSKSSSAAYAHPRARLLDSMRAALLKTFLSYTLRRLGTDYIDLYQPTRLDPNVPIEDVVGAIAEMVKGGYVRHIGLSAVWAQNIS